ncbi:MAG: Uma2 family endonuclease [Planctomycetaceae bacterium]|nr:Uma2 family endonuclease [Planctomycetaceae bacterium]
MSTGLLTKASKWKDDVPLLYAGDHLHQREFHRRYEAYPDPAARFELIGGIVYMMTPAGYDHSKGDYRITGLVFQYERATRGVEGGQNVTVILGEASEPQPDNVLMIRAEYGGKVRIRGKKTRYIVGPPELVFEIAHSSLSIDLYEKRRDYRTGGVLEYLVLDIERRAVHWFDLRADEPLKIPADGIVKSRAFPGFWIDTRALMARDVNRLADCLDRGIASEEHGRFVAELASRRRQRGSGGRRQRPNQTGG